MGIADCGGQGSYVFIVRTRYHAFAMSTVVLLLLVYIILPGLDPITTAVPFGGGGKPFRTAVPLWGQTTLISSSLSPKRDCGSQSSKHSLSPKLSVGVLLVDHLRELNLISWATGNRNRVRSRGDSSNSKVPDCCPLNYVSSCMDWSTYPDYPLLQRRYQACHVISYT